jgi:LysM repeat protein
MRRFSMQLLLWAMFPVAGPLAASAEEAAAPELRELHQAVQQQSRQIELLAEQIGKLTRALESQKSAAMAPAAPAPPASEAAKPPTEPASEAARSEPATKAEAASIGTKHVVAKGETLTSIAKQYNIPIADLKNANRIENERKLQIGQILTVPAANTPENSEKKENP